MHLGHSPSPTLVEDVDTALKSLPERTLAAVREAAAGCVACPLYKLGTQTVFGEGAPGARLMMIGEQPGDVEDVTGRPFVGPAGKLFDRLLVEAGIDRTQAYVTNAVKHFKWERQGKRRIHKKPNDSEITACKPWLYAEIELVAPKVIVLLGATAAQALLGKDFRVTRQRGMFIPSSLAPFVLATIHPSALLRIPDEGAQAAASRRFVEDLRLAARALGE